MVPSLWSPALNARYGTTEALFLFFLVSINLLFLLTLNIQVEVFADPNFADYCLNDSLCKIENSDDDVALDWIFL